MQTAFKTMPAEIADQLSMRNGLKNILTELKEHDNLSISS